MPDLNTSAADGLQELLLLSPVIPVLMVERVEDAVPLAEALVGGGLKVLEVTLRTAHALDVIEAMAKAVPEAVIAAGTVTSAAQLAAARQAGARFAVSPGLTPSLLEALQEPGALPLLPGVATASELMVGLEAGLRCFKLFPAEAAGGVGLLRSFHGPFPRAVFCPTGGITPETAPRYLALPNVACIGGSWMATPEAIKERRWQEIRDLATRASALL